MMEKKFANRVSREELAWFLYDLDKNGYIILSRYLLRQIENNDFYYTKCKDYPNIVDGNEVYELTDFSLVKHLPADCWGFEDNYEFYPEHSVEFAKKEVRMFLLMKFGQEYLDFLLGPDVATLNPSFVKRSEEEQEKGKSIRLNRKF